jgi:hypothetical protein
VREDVWDQSCGGWIKLVRISRFAWIKLVRISPLTVAQAHENAWIMLVGNDTEWAKRTKPAPACYRSFSPCSRGSVASFPSGRPAMLMRNEPLCELQG